MSFFYRSPGVYVVSEKGSLTGLANLGGEWRDLADVLKRRRVQMSCLPMDNLSTERRQLCGC